MGISEVSLPAVFTAENITSMSRASWYKREMKHLLRKGDLEEVINEYIDIS